MSDAAFDPAVLARRDILEMEDYHPAPSGNGRKLDRNESPWGLPESLRRKLIDWLGSEENLNRYPDSDNTALRRSIARFWGISPDNVTCGVGSDQLIDSICRVFLEPGERVITLEPTFGMYAVSARLNHGSAVAVPIGESSDMGRNIVRAAESERAKVVFLCSPNNPTGLCLPSEDILFVLENSRSIVAIDEAYGDFAGTSMIPDLDRYPNMIALRTFSKAFGLAGARVGYAAASGGIIGLLDRVKPPFNIPTVSQLLAEWAMGEAREYGLRTRELSGLRDEFRDELKTMSWIDVSRSDANFLHITSERDIASILEDSGVSVRRLPRAGNRFCARVTVGTREENKKASDALWNAGLK